jgi:hypothetical protein
MLILHLEDEQQARWWPQFRDIVSPFDMKNMNRCRLGWQDIRTLIDKLVLRAYRVATL